MSRAPLHLTKLLFKCNEAGPAAVALEVRISGQCVQQPPYFEELCDSASAAAAYSCTWRVGSAQQTRKSSRTNLSAAGLRGL